MESKKLQYTEAESKAMVARGREVVDIGRGWSNDIKLQFYGMN